MIKADITESVREKAGFSKQEATQSVEVVVETIKDALGRGEKIKIPGFGNFVVRQKKSHVGRNPRTGEGIQIAARRAVTFQCSQTLKNALNPDATKADGLAASVERPKAQAPR